MAGEIEEAARNIALRSQDGEQRAVAIHERAEMVHTESERQRTHAGEIHQSIYASLKQALKDIDLTKKLKEATERYRSYLEPLRSRCEGCTTLYCMKCPAGCYNLKSNIESLDPNLTGEERYKARWTGLNKNMCKVFMLNDVIHKSLLTALRS